MSTKSETENILQEADRLTGGDRHRDYGNARADAERFTQIARAITGLPLKVEHWPLLMIAVKLSRESYAHKHDNLVDIAGYARVAEMVYEELNEVEDTGLTRIDAAMLADAVCSRVADALRKPGCTHEHAANVARNTVVAALEVMDGDEAVGFTD